MLPPGVVPFKNRDQAAFALAGQLRKLGLEEPHFLGIPTGGAVVAAALSSKLNSTFGLVIVKKLSLPNDPEIAIGAVSEEGDLIIGSVIDEYGISEEESEKDASREIDRLQELRKFYAQEAGFAELEGRTVVIVDDGIASGATAVTALRMLQRYPIARLVVAAPVSSESGCALLEAEGAEVCAVHIVEDLESIREYYESFESIGEQQVKELLHRPPLS